MIRKRKYPYWLNLLIAVDQLFSASAGWDCDVTYSAVLGEKLVEKGTKALKWFPRPLEALLQRLLDRMEKDHCRKSYLTELRLAELRLML